MNAAAFCHNMLQSRLFDCSVTHADEYAELLDVEVKCVLDIHAPLRTGQRRSGQQVNRQLSDEACRAKQLRRRCKRRYRRTGLESDRQAYLSACSVARVHATAFSSYEMTISDPNWTRYPVTSAPPGEWHRDYYTTTTRSYTTTPSVRNLSLRSVSSSWTMSTGSATSRRHYDRQVVACSLFGHTADRRCQISGQWLSTRFDDSCVHCQPTHRHLTCFRAHYCMKTCTDVFPPAIDRLANFLSMSPFIKFKHVR